MKKLVRWLLLSCALVPAAANAGTVSITITEHGIPHINASDFRGLGYGYAHALAENDICGLADTFATYDGARALRFGEDKSDIQYILGRRPINNAVSDFGMRLMVEQHAPRNLTPQLSALVQGYAEGFNHYLATTPAADLPDACRGSDALKPITQDTIHRRVNGFAMLLSSGLFLQDLYDAAPPTDEKHAVLESGAYAQEPMLAGSNAYAFGKDTTDNGRGLLLGNPHFFWDGPNRFTELHLTVLGQYDAMGMAVLGMPLITVGFNKSLAWSHTVSTDARASIYRLILDPADPTRYLVDGKWVAMTRKHIEIQARTKSGAIEKRSHDFYLTRYGPVLTNKALPWTKQFAYALADANQKNGRSLQQWLEIGAAPNVTALKASLDKNLGTPWLNTIAADRDGNAFYGDISVAPNFDAAKLAACAVPGITIARASVLDGSRTDCTATVDASTPEPGLLPPAKRPSMTRTDFVANSNASYWLTNASAPLEGFSPVIGAERTAQNFRTRQGQVQVRDRLAGRDGLPGDRMSMQAVEKILFSDRSLQGELVLNDLLAACKGSNDANVQRGCAALAKWDKRYALDSIAAHVFSEFTMAAAPGEDMGTTPSLWRVPFDPTDPVNTPRDLDTSNPAVLKALAAAVEKLDKAGIPLDAKLGDVQFVVRHGERIPLHGGATYSALRATLTPNVGYTEPMGPSNSYIQVVTFDENGPVADAILASSQTPDPKSPFYADQTKSYSRGEWTRLPFTPAAVAAQAIRPPLVLAVPSR
ncbi:MAG: aculeacin acylase [Rhodospirillales bacterium]|nr:aculeacin acylase [Rhodospirillales bacterium]